MVCAANNCDSILDVKCWHCGADYVVMVNRQDVVDWLSGAGSIQDILHYLTSAERELLISNTCDDCFKSFFA